jgi:hypothetical protein
VSIEQLTDQLYELCRAGIPFEEFAEVGLRLTSSQVVLLAELARRAAERQEEPAWDVLSRRLRTLTSVLN